MLDVKDYKMSVRSSVLSSDILNVRYFFEIVVDRTLLILFVRIQSLCRTVHYLPSMNVTLDVTSLNGPILIIHSMTKQIS